MQALQTDWSNKLDDALWAYWTAFMTPIGMFPYRLVYEKACHLSMELDYRSYWATRLINFNSEKVREMRLLELNELYERRTYAYENQRLYEDRLKRWHDKFIKRTSFEVGHKVLFYNLRLRLIPEKVKS